MVTMITIQSSSAFSPIIEKMLPKKYPFSHLKIKFLWGWACQILEKDHWKNRAKTGKLLNFPRLSEGIFPIYRCIALARIFPILPF